MARVSGVNIPPNKHIIIALQSIYGIGPTRAKVICTISKVDPSMKVKALSEGALEFIRQGVAKYKVEGELRREVATHKRRLEAVKCYRGIRHLRHLPTRGQRTRTNARTRKGPRKLIRK
jgi:small subunit ribosomal protein S13